MWIFFSTLLPGECLILYYLLSSAPTTSPDLLQIHQTRLCVQQLTGYDRVLGEACLGFSVFTDVAPAACLGQFACEVRLVSSILSRTVSTMS